MKNLIGPRSKLHIQDIDYQVYSKDDFFFIYFFSCLDILIQQSQVVPGQNTSLWHNNKPLCLGRMITTCQKVIRRELCMDKQRRLDEGISFKVKILPQHQNLTIFFNIFRILISN